MKNVLLVCLGLLSFVVAAIAALASVKWLFDRFSGFLKTLDPTLFPAIISAAAVITVAVVTFIMQRQLERFRSREASLRSEKRAAYESLLATMLAGFGLEEKHLAGDALVKSMNANIRPLLLNASNEVLKSWREFTRMSATFSDGGNPTTKETIAQFVALEKIIKSIRKDMGHSTITLNEGDLVSIFFREFQQLRDGENLQSKSISS